MLWEREASPVSAGNRTPVLWPSKSVALRYPGSLLTPTGQLILNSIAIQPVGAVAVRTELSLTHAPAEGRNLRTDGCDTACRYAAEAVEHLLTAVCNPAYTCTRDDVSRMLELSHVSSSEKSVGLHRLCSCVFSRLLCFFNKVITDTLHQMLLLRRDYEGAGWEHLLHVGETRNTAKLW
jgi:hypothetical protein